MSVIIVDGPCKLGGEVTVQGAKNSTLPLLAASIICGGETVLTGCPRLSDVDSAVRILELLGVSCSWSEDKLIINAGSVTGCEIPHSLMREMRSSIVFLGAILSRQGEAILSFPGGCEIGARPIDLHLSALKKMGVEIKESHGRLICTAPNGIIGGYVSLDFPSVGATENIILAAAVSKGTTIIQNAAREPEILDLARFLNRCGARIYGAGESSITIEGVESIRGCEYKVMPDRIVAATYMACAAITGGEILLRNSPNACIMPMIPVFEETGCSILTERDTLYISAPKKLKAIGSIRTMPYPGFPTDAQAPVMTMAALAVGTTVFIENIFECRYKHVSELVRLGANIKTEGRVAVVEGVPGFSGAPVKASDLRGGAALVAAGLAAQGRTTVSGVEYIDRGYEKLEDNLRRMGARIIRGKE